jgi:hypothetical protein
MTYEGPFVGYTDEATLRRRLPPVLRVPLAAILASLAAGPIIILFLITMSLASGEHAPEVASGLPGLLALALFYGFIFAILPNLLGCVGMFLLSLSCSPARHIGWWTVAGAIAAFALCVALDFVRGGPVTVLPFVATGACCAAICRIVAAPD